MNAPSRSLLAAAFEACVGIVRSRKGPEDVPASAALLVTVLAGTVLLGLASLAIPVPESRGNGIVLIALDIGLWLAGVRLILQVAKRPERFLQTVTAIFGCQLVLAPLLLGSNWMLITYIRQPGMGELAVMLSVAVMVWVMVITARILRSATGWAMISTVLLTFSIEAVKGVVYLGLYPPAPAVTPAT